MQSHTKGSLIALAGVIAVSPDAMLLRSMRALGASSPDVAVAKYIGIIAFMSILGAVKGTARARASIPHFLAAALAQLAYQLSFTFCLLLTDAAKALLLISLAPLWAALFGVAVLREPLPCRTGCALALSLVAVGVVFTPRLLSLQGGGYTAGPYSLAGDLLAIFTGAAQGASLTVNRHAAVHAPKADLTLATALSSLLATVVALYLPCYDSNDPHDFWECTPPVWRTPAFLSLAAADAIAVACFYVALLYAPRYITGGEVALITLLEVVAGPLFIYFRFGEIPSGWTVAGGALLLGTLAAHEACGLHSAAAETMRSPMRRAAPSPASPNEESSPIPYQPAEVYGL